MDVIADAKDLLAQPHGRIKLYDLVLAKVGELAQATSTDEFALNSEWSDEDFHRRLQRYMDVTSELRAIAALMAYWGESRNKQSLILPFVRFTEGLESGPATRGYLSLQWYPVLALLYTSGIAALAGERYENLAALLDTCVQPPFRSRRGTEVPIVLVVFEGISNLGDAFKTIPAYAQRYTAMNDYLGDALMEDLKGLGIVGTDYERHFDRFEVLLALEHSHLNSRRKQEGGWGPPGRFVWKHLGSDDGGPFRALVKEAERQEEKWGPAKAGLFGGSSDRFREVARTYSAWMVRLGWH